MVREGRWICIAVSSCRNKTRDVKPLFSVENPDSQQKVSFSTSPQATKALCGLGLEWGGLLYYVYAIVQRDQHFLVLETALQII